MGCNNCSNSGKCNQSNKGLEKVSNTQYKGEEGYYIYENYQWVFVPIEKSLDINKLTLSLGILQNLNDHKKCNRLGLSG